MANKMCMGNPMNRVQCEKCYKLARKVSDEKLVGPWIDWKDIKIGNCEEFEEVD